MPHYRYQVKEAGGALASGIVTAESVHLASQTLRERGNYILAIGPAGQAKITATEFLKKLNVSSGPSQKDVLNFTSQLAVMIKAGISIRSAIEAIADQIDNPRFQSIVEEIKRDVESGKQFSDALGKHKRVFSPLYVNMVRASELSGSFGHMLERIAAYLGQQLETRSMVRSAMVYPCLILFMAASTTIFLLTFVLPRFIVLFEGKEAALPMPTKILMAISAFMVDYWYILLLAVVGAAWGFILMVKTPWGRFWWDKTKITVPIFRKLTRSLYISRSMHTMGELVNAGVPMLDTIHITGNITGNVLYQKLWRAVHKTVKDGKKIAFSLSRTQLLPRSVVQMVSSGEESGRLGEVLTDVSEFYAKELRTVIKNVTAMIEPLMIIAMGIVVGFIAMSIILPIFKLSSLVN